MRRVVAGALTILVIVLAAASPAVAGSRIGLSRDGVTFTRSLDAPLFDPAILWVPGEVRAESFYVRNLAPDDADLAIDVIGESGDSLLATGHVMVSARGGDDVWRDVTTAGVHRLVSATDLVAGRAAKVDVKVALLEGASNTTQTRRLDLDVRVLLSQDAGRPVPDDSGMLPATGAPALWSLIAGVCLVAAGIVLVRRRREKENSHV